MKTNQKQVETLVTALLLVIGAVAASQSTRVQAQSAAPADGVFAAPLVPMPPSPSVLSETQLYAEQHSLRGAAPGVAPMGFTGVHFNPNPPPVPDLTEKGTQYGSHSLGGGTSYNLNPRYQTGGSERVYDMFPHWRAGWDKGFTIAPVDPKQNPFELRINAMTQARFTVFARDQNFWVNDAGQVGQQLNLNDLSMTRTLMAFSGYAWDERITYDIWVGGSTTLSPDVFILPNIGYKFSKQFYPRFGMGRMPFSSQFVMEDFFTQFVDRSIATTFFQADFTQGVWATGELIEDKLKYWSMAGVGAHAFATNVQDLDNQYGFGHMFIWNARGDYGDFIADLEDSECPAVRLTQSYLYIPVAAQPNGQPFGEANWYRFSDGSQVVQTGALAPGVTVNSFKTYGLAQSIGYKYRGLGLFAEWMGLWYQDLGSIGGTIPNDRLNIFNHGFTAQAGYFVVPKKLEYTFRTSHIYGPLRQDAGQGDHGQEYVLGASYYINGQLNKLSAQVGYVKNNPAQLEFTHYRAGQTGILAMLQWQLGF